MVLQFSLCLLCSFSVGQFQLFLYWCYNVLKYLVMESVGLKIWSKVIICLNHLVLLMLTLLLAYWGSVLTTSLTIMLVQDFVPCILVTFEKEQIVVWRGKDYKPTEVGQFPIERESFDNWDSDMVDGGEQHKRSDDSCSQLAFYSGDEE